MDYKKVLRLHFVNHLSIREIADSCGDCGKSAVGEFLKRFRECPELSHPLPNDVTNEYIESRNISKNPNLQSGTKAMHGIRSLACRRLTNWKHQNIWCILLSGISKVRFPLKRLTHFCRSTTRKILPVMRQTAPRKPIRFPHGSPRYFPSVPSALRQMNISPFTRSCLQESIPTPDVFGLITSRRRNGCWVFYFQTVAYSCFWLGQHKNDGGILHQISAHIGLWRDKRYFCRERMVFS